MARKNLANEINKNPALLKYMFDNQKIYEETLTRTQFRKIPDVSTSAFVDVFFKNHPNTLKQFINYCYQTLNFNILNTINESIYNQKPDTNNNLKLFTPLNHNEETSIIFKGGTNMNFIYNHLINYITITPAIDPQVKQDLLLFLNEKYDSNFKVSDTDMTLHIYSESNRRFLILQKASYQKVIETLDNISQTLDYLFNNNNINVILPPLPPYTTVENVFFDNIFSFIERLNHEKETKSIDQNILFIRNTFISSSIIFSNCQINSYLIEFIDYIKFNNKIDNLINNINNPELPADLLKYREDLFLYAQHDLNSIRNKLQTLYTDAKKVEFKQNLLTKLVEYKTDVEPSNRIENNTELYKARLDEQEIYKYFKKPILDNIIININNINIPPPPLTIPIIAVAGSAVDVERNNDAVNNAVNPDLNNSGRPDVFLFDINNATNPVKIQSINNNRLHYLSVNHSIANMVANSKINNFNLARIKLNIKLKDCCIDFNKTPIKDFENYNVATNNYVIVDAQNEAKITAYSQANANIDTVIDKDIPSEILDISLSEHFSQKTLQYKEFTKIGKYLAVKLEDKYEIICYGYLQLFMDLKDVLYKQMHFTPWIDNKYNKRISRMFIFYVLGNLFELNKDYQTYIFPILTKIKNLCDCILGARDPATGNIIPANFANNLGANVQYTDLLAEFCNTPGNINVNYCDEKLITSKTFSELVNIKYEYLIIEDILDSIIINTTYYNNDVNYINLLEYYSDMYNYSAPVDINTYKTQFREYVKNIYEIINNTIILFNLYINSVPGYRYEQVINIGGGHRKLYNKLKSYHNKKTKNNKTNKKTKISKN